MVANSIAEEEDVGYRTIFGGELGEELGGRGQRTRQDKQRGGQPVYRSLRAARSGRQWGGTTTLIEVLHG
jgi:hypothetical protein